MENSEKEKADVTNITTKSGEIGKKQPLKIDFDSILASNRDESPSEVVVVPSTSAVVTGDQPQRTAEKRRKKFMADSSSASSSSSCSAGDDLSTKSEVEIKAVIERTAGNIATLSAKLPDKGAKIKAYMQRLEEELERRKNGRPQKDDDSGCKKSAHSAGASSNGELDGPKQAVHSSQPSEWSQLASCFTKKLEDNVKPISEPNTGDQASNTFNSEKSHFNRCEKRKRKPVGPPPQSKRKSMLCSKEFSAWNPPTGSHNSERYMPLNGKLAGRASSTCLLRPLKEKLAGSFTEKGASQAMNSDGSKNEKTLVLVDEEESEPVKKKQEAEQLPTSAGEGKIYYPSREDPESLEIFRSELKCLEPGECLTSTIMNFYIRFLLESATERSRHNLYFFNTYFYSKLQKAVAHQKSDEKAFFMKFRRWWRGVNIFQKAYIFLPINEDNHWSLVIICIGDQEDESGPLILHLDSLGLHCSQSIFKNIRSLLENEWKFLSEDGDALDIPISERTWKFLPRRIDGKIITVPRQTNDYDCGLFVLYYMERFIEEAPERLKRQHLEMFGENWFKPQEASRLRGKIKKILQEKFHKELKKDARMWQPVCLSANAEAPKGRSH